MLNANKMMRGNRMHVLPPNANASAGPRELPEKKPGAINAF